MRTTLGKLVWGTALWAVLSVATAGDILLIEKIEERQQLDLPSNGVDMSQVENRFGSPVEKRPAVGDPPITRWVYPDFSVFFEHDLVIESVVHNEAIVDETETRDGS